MKTSREIDCLLVCLFVFHIIHQCSTYTFNIFLGKVVVIVLGCLTASDTGLCESSDDTQYVD